MTSQSVRVIIGIVFILFISLMILGMHGEVVICKDSLFGLIYFFPLLLVVSFYGMKSVASFMIRGKSLAIIYLMSFITNSLCNYTILDYYPNFSPYNIFLMLMIPAAYSTGLIFLAWSLMRAWSLLIILPFLLIQYIQEYSHSFYGCIINSLVIAETMEASAEDASAYLALGNIVSYVCILLFVVAIGYGLYRLLRKERSLTLAQNALLLLVLSCICTALPHPYSYNRIIWPINEISRLSDSYEEAINHNQGTIKYVKCLKSPSSVGSRISTLNGDEGLVFILHIGESTLASRMSINGYERDTTPHLKMMDNLINFPVCIASASSTCNAQITMLTDARRDVMKKESGMGASTGSVLDLFTKHGFDHYNFLGRKLSEQLKYDMVGHMLASYAIKTFHAPGSPWSSLPQIDSVLEKSGKRNLLIYINNEGSHTPYQHFDHNNPPFSPTAKNFNNPKGQAAEVNNSYDNTIHYTDEFIHRLVTRLKGRSFIYIFVADHGEVLGEKGMWGRGALGLNRERFYQASASHVGMFIITSPEFGNLHPHFAEAVEVLQNNAKIIVAHEHIFHSLLGIFGIKTPFYQENLDLSSPKVKPYSGPMQDYLRGGAPKSYLLPDCLKTSPKP